MWHDYDCSAACRVVYVVVPEVGCYFVKVRNMWLPRTAGESFISQKCQEHLPFRGLLDRVLLHCVSRVLSL